MRIIPIPEGLPVGAVTWHNARIAVSLPFYRAVTMFREGSAVRSVYGPHNRHCEHVLEHVFDDVWSNRTSVRLGGGIEHVFDGRPGIE